MSKKPFVDYKDTRWFRRTDASPILFDVVGTILTRTNMRREMDLYHACLYDDSELTGLGPSSFSLTEFQPSTLAFNVVRQAVDTLSAKIGKNQPLPTPVTSGGNWLQQRRAREFGKFIEGQFDLAGVWRTSPTIARDCSLFGTGITHNYRVDDTIYHDRVLPWEIVVDPREAIYGKPRSIYMRRWVDRYVLAERFPDHQEDIMSSDNPTYDGLELGYDDSADLVLVVEAWHLPSRVIDTTGKGEDDETAEDASHDGRHVIAVSNRTILNEPWRKQYFPFTVLRMAEPIVGYFGTGLAKMLTGLQYTINDTASVVQEAHALSGGYILVEAGSNVQTDKLTNGRGNILNYNGTMPNWVNPPPVHPDTWNFVLSLIPKAFEMSGVSQLSAQSQKPAGIESALALNTFNDFETERFASFAKQFEDYHVDIAWQFFDLAEEINKEFGTYKVRTTTRERGQWRLPELDFSNVKLDRNTFTLKVMPTSNLSRKFAGRVQEVQTLANAGWIGPEDAKMLLDFPDLDRWFNLDLASRRIIEASIDKMLTAEDTEDPDVYTYPEPSFNLELCRKLGVAMYLDAKLDNAPDENLQLVLRFVSDATAELDRLKNPPQEAVPPAPPAGPEMAPPAGQPSPDMGVPPEVVGSQAPPEMTNQTVPGLNPGVAQPLT